MLRRNWKGAARAAVGIGIAAAIVYTSASFQSCVHEIPKQAAAEQFPERIAKFLPIFDAYVRACPGEFIHKNWESITAFFTFVLAISTIYLWSATRNLYEAGERQLGIAKESAEAAKVSAEAAMLSAQALMSADKAHLFIILDGEDAKNAIIQGSMVSGDGSLPLRVRFRFKNHGKTLAVLTSMSRGLINVPANANAIGLETAQDFPFGQVLDASGETDWEPCYLSIPLTDAKAIASGQAKLWFSGLVEFRDVFGHERQWLWHHEYTRDSWRLIHYEEREKPKS
jgi:hypothetical protein